MHGHVSILKIPDTRNWHTEQHHGGWNSRAVVLEAECRCVKRSVKIVRYSPPWVFATMDVIGVGQSLVCSCRPAGGDSADWEV